MTVIREIYIVDPDDSSKKIKLILDGSAYRFPTDAKITEVVVA